MPTALRDGPVPAPVLSLGGITLLRAGTSLRKPFLISKAKKQASPSRLSCLASESFLRKAQEHGAYRQPQDPLHYFLDGEPFVDSSDAPWFLERMSKIGYREGENFE